MDTLAAAVVSVCVWSRTGKEKKADEQDAGSQVGQDEFGQQRYGALAGLAQVAAHAEDAVVGDIDERAGVETVRSECTFGQALGAVVGSIPIGVGKRFFVLLNGA